MPSRLEQKSATRVAILNAVALEFSAKGFEGTTFSGIAERMGRPRSAIGYHQFRSKQAMAAALIEHQSARWQALIDSAEIIPAGITRLLSVLLTAAIEASNDPQAAAALRLLLEARTNPAITVPVLQVRWREYAFTQISADQESGVLPPDVKVAEFVGFVLNSALGVFEAENRGFQPTDTTDTLVNLWDRLLAGFDVPDRARILATVVELH